MAKGMHWYYCLNSLSFVATANAVTYSNATPHFVDSASNTLGIDPEKLNDYLFTHTEQRSGFCFNKSTNKRIKAIIPMHTFGHPVELEPLLKVTRKFNIDMVEDAAESLGSFYKGKHTGTFGLVGTLSFNGNKIITGGGGGCIITIKAQYTQ
jgi:perosamine synthetase